MVKVGLRNGIETELSRFDWLFIEGAGGDSATAGYFDWLLCSSTQCSKNNYLSLEVGVKKYNSN